MNNNQNQPRTIASLLILTLVISGGVGLWFYRSQRGLRPTGLNPPPKVSDQPLETIGGQRDEHGCLGPAGYSWDQEVGACLRAWELDTDAKEAARMAVSHLGSSYALTIIEVSATETPGPGCYLVTMEKGVARDQVEVKLDNWQVVASPQCGLESCHGLDLTCGSNVPQVCDLMYQLGDRCRQFAHCQILNSRCELVLDPKFAQCKACFEQCEKDFPQDQIQLTQCESSCAE